jgi:glycosyltransferase involved in cell wall biosynthesis
MSLPQVSILVPVFNAGPFFAECLDSILGQDFGDYELLISDDGSTDGTVALIERYAATDPRIRWWQNPRNLGLTENHSHCLREARGEYVKFVHQDDKLLHPSVLSRMVEILEKDTTVSLVAMGSQVIDDQSQVLSVRNYFRQSGTRDGTAVIVKCLEENTNLIGEPTATMFRLSHAQRGFDGRYRLLMDLEMWFHLLEQRRFAFLAEPLFAYRVHPQQETATIRRTVGSAQEYLDLVTDYYRKPWLAGHITRQLLFTQIRCLRKHSGEKAGPLTADMMARLKPSWYALYWLKRKTTRPAKRILQQLGARSQ